MGELGGGLLEHGHGSHRLVHHQVGLGHQLSGQRAVCALSHVPIATSTLNHLG